VSPPGAGITSMRTAMAALAMTAGSSFSGSATSRPPLTGRHCDVADGRAILDFFELHLVRPLDTDGDLHIQFGLSIIDERTKESQL
jgi:hypothetical protein